jgi:hypothetical protein
MRVLQFMTCYRQPVSNKTASRQPACCNQVPVTPSSAVFHSTLPLLVALPLQVSLDIQLAVGITDSQEAAGADQALASWLAQPRGMIQAVSSNPGLAFGSDLLIKWLKTPEIWTNLVRVQQAVQQAAGFRVPYQWFADGSCSPVLP